METPFAVEPARVKVPNQSVTVFGASWCKPGEELYEEGEKVGAAIAAKGFKLINGGYSGTMEATAKGAALVGGTEIEGVVVPQLFQNRGPGGNEYLTTAIPTATLLDRIQYMVQNSSYFIIMNGTLGTLTEAAIIWNMALLAPLANEERPMILLYREPWEALMQTIAVALKLGPDVLSCLRYIDTADEAVGIIAEDYARRTSSAPSTGAAAM